MRRPSRLLIAVSVGAPLAAVWQVSDYVDRGQLFTLVSARGSSPSIRARQRSPDLRQLPTRLPASLSTSSRGDATWWQRFLVVPGQFLALSTLGLSLAGATLRRSTRRERRSRLRATQEAETAIDEVDSDDSDDEDEISKSAMRRNRYPAIFGGKGPPIAPDDWFSGRDKTENGEVIPPWFTRQFWEGLKASERARALWWYKMRFDENGNPAFDRETETYSVTKAVDILLAMIERSPFEFDMAFEAHLRFNLDPRYPDQQLRTVIKLPYGLGSERRVAVACPPDEEAEVLGYGACQAGETLLAAIKAEKMDFDVLLAKPMMMPQLAKLGRILGPKGLMPSPKTGTVVVDYEKAISDFGSGGTLELKATKESSLKFLVGRVSQGREKIIENFTEAFSQLADKAPAGATNPFWKSVFIKGQKTPAVPIGWKMLPRVKSESDD